MFRFLLCGLVLVITSISAVAMPGGGDFRGGGFAHWIFGGGQFAQWAFGAGRLARWQK